MKYKKWTEAEVNILRKFYENHGGNYCLNFLAEYRNLRQVHRKARAMGLSRSKETWRDDEIQVLKNFYERHGGRYCLQFLSSDRNLGQVRWKAKTLGLETKTTMSKQGVEKHLWEPEENAVLLHYYSQFGVKYCLQFLPEYRTREQVQCQAGRLGLVRKNYNSILRARNGSNE